jgi:23S rRNA (adenine2503-C2)-methyltransferase
MQDIKDYGLKELEKKLFSFVDKPYHAKQIFSWIYKRGVLDFNCMSDIPKELRSRLLDNFYILGFSLYKSVKSKDGTLKLLFKKGTDLIEAVLIPSLDRVTGCVSSQVGCKFRCSFCASGLFGLKRNLTAGEIIEEVLYLKENAFENKLTHIVFMGIGEPLDNYENVIKAIRIINSNYGLNIGARKITISTCGIIPGIERLSKEGLQVELSVSLHAPTNSLRSRLMPVNKKYPLEKLIKACKKYCQDTKRQVTFEYILIKDVNSSLKEAEELCLLLKGFNLFKVNLIPSNYIPEFKLIPPEKDKALFFKNYFLKRGIHATFRKERGVDISAACGQLRLNYFL